MLKKLFICVISLCIAGCACAHSVREQKGIKSAESPTKRITRADVPLRAEWLSSGQLKGTWETSFKKVSFLTSSNSHHNGREKDVFMTMAFNGEGRCDVKYAEYGVLTSSFQIDYDRGFLVFKSRSERLRDRALIFLRASTFEIVKIDDECFELRFADLPVLAEQLNVASINSRTYEYLENGLLRHLKTANNYAATELTYPMIFKKTSPAVSITRVSDPSYRAPERKVDGDFAFKLQFARASDIQERGMHGISRSGVQRRAAGGQSQSDNPPKTGNRREVNSVAVDETTDSVSPEVPQAPSRKANEILHYNILSCKRETGNDFAYRFELEIVGTNSSMRTFRAVQQEFRKAVKEDYAESVPGVAVNELYVDFPEYELKDGKINGRAVVLAISVTSFSYDPSTRIGRLAVKVNANQYEEARKWIRKNIETLARDKNIALTTGTIPPEARFYLGREELKDGSVLEIEFKTE